LREGGAARTAVGVRADVVTRRLESIRPAPGPRSSRQQVRSPPHTVRISTVGSPPQDRYWVVSMSPDPGGCNRGMLGSSYSSAARRRAAHSAVTVDDGGCWRRCCWGQSLWLAWIRRSANRGIRRSGNVGRLHPTARSIRLASENVPLRPSDTNGSVPCGGAARHVRPESRGTDRYVAIRVLGWVRGLASCGFDRACGSASETSSATRRARSLPGSPSSSPNPARCRVGRGSMRSDVTVDQAEHLCGGRLCTARTSLGVHTGWV